MSDQFYRDPGWLTAFAGLVTAAAGFITGVVFGRRRLKINGSRALSQSEADFRRDVMARLESTEKRHEQCENDRQACREENLRLALRIGRIEDDIKDLRDELAQTELPLQARRG